MHDILGLLFTLNLWISEASQQSHWQDEAVSTRGGSTVKRDTDVPAIKDVKAPEVVSEWVGQREEERFGKTHGKLPVYYWLCLYICICQCLHGGGESHYLLRRTRAKNGSKQKKRKRSLSGRCHAISAGELMTPLTTDSQRALHEACEGDLWRKIKDQ